LLIVDLLGLLVRASLPCLLLRLLLILEWKAVVLVLGTATQLR